MRASDRRKLHQLDMSQSMRLRSLVVLALALFLIYGLGMTRAGLWDPWETHYGEVARNIVARHDPMDLRWRPGVGPDGQYESLFRSKHVLPFWGMALGLRAFGLGERGPIDEMVTSSAVEWALRLPSMIVGLGAAFFLAWVIARLVRPSAGFWVLAVLGTLPHFALISRQAITDVYVVAPLVAGLAAWAMAWLIQPRQLRRRWGLAWSDPAVVIWLAVFALFAVAPWAMLLLYAGSEAAFARVYAWRDHAGAPRIEDLERIVDHLRWYALPIALVVLIAWRSRTTRELWLSGTYLAAGLAFMGKGLLGPGLLAVTLLADAWSAGLWRQRLAWSALLRTLVPGLLIFAVSAAPWHHAMAIFRGEGWVNELLIVNNLERFIQGEQAHAIGDLAYYLAIFSVAAFPWVAFVPWIAADGFWQMQRLAPGNTLSEGADSSGARVRLIGLFGLALIVAFGVITASATKYAHYLAPCMPPFAVLAGLWIDRQVQGEGLGTHQGGATSWILSCCIALTALIGLWQEPAALVHLTTYLYTGDWREGAALPVYFGLAGSVAIAAGWLALRRFAGADVEAKMSATTPVIAKTVTWRQWLTTWHMVALASALATAGLFADYIPAASENWSQKTAMTHYFRERRRGEELLSAWFYHRGETFYTKARVWVLMQPDGSKLRDYFRQEAHEVQEGASKRVWVVASRKNLSKVQRFVPSAMQNTLTVVYENFHLVLFHVTLKGSSSPLMAEPKSSASDDMVVPSVPGLIDL